MAWDKNMGAKQIIKYTQLKCFYLLSLLTLRIKVGV